MLETAVDSQKESNIHQYHDVIKEQVQLLKESDLKLTETKLKHEKLQADFQVNEDRISDALRIIELTDAEMKNQKETIDQSVIEKAKIKFDTV